MDATSPEVHLPSSVLTALADGCEEAGAAAVAALREAGRAAGTDLFARMADGGGEAAGLTPSEFWKAVAADFEEMGLGPVRYEVLAGGVAAVTVPELPEAGGGDGGRHSSGCPFSTGLLGGIASAAADRAVAVLEVECRSRNGEACRFLLGSEDRLEEVRRRVLDGASVSEAVEAS